MVHCDPFIGAHSNFNFTKFLKDLVKNITEMKTTINPSKKLSIDEKTCAPHETICPSGCCSSKSKFKTFLKTIDQSCKNQCWHNFDAEDPCHCDIKCEEHGNCCDDFEKFCFGGLAPKDIRG